MSAILCDSKTSVAVLCQLICSIGVMLFNKLAVQAFPQEAAIVAVHMLLTALATLPVAARSFRIGSLWDAARWSLTVPFYAGTMLTSMLMLKHSPMTLVVVFRSLSPLGTMLVERCFPEPLQCSLYTLGSITVMFIGTALYAAGTPRSDFRSLHWVLINTAFIAAEHLLRRLMLAKSQDPVDISMSAAALLSNVEGIFPVLAVMAIKHEFSAIPMALRSLTPAGTVWIALSCIVSIGITYTGLWTQSLISATSFLVLLNISKFMIVFLDGFCFGPKGLLPMQTIGACLVILGGVAYSRSRTRTKARRSSRSFGSLPSPRESTRLCAKP